jgi:hypothetical protein
MKLGRRASKGSREDLISNTPKGTPSKHPWFLWTVYLLCEAFTTCDRGWGVCVCVSKGERDTGRVATCGAKRQMRSCASLV